MRFLLFLILCPILLLASDNAMASGQNYIVRRDYLNATGTEYVDVVEYFDGLGRSVETVQRGITPSGQSLVTVREYDSQSRLAREWQPVVSPNTDFKFDRGGEITYRNDGEGRRMEVTHRISSASASLAGKPVPSAAYKTVLKRKYIDHFVYRNDTLEYILTPTGYIDRDGNYYHYQKDSRGSVRTVIDGAGRIVERNDYYPYGMLMNGVSKSVQPYKFGGKELDRIGGINHYDFHARQLQLPIPHFYQQDPYADKYPHLSPYLYCAANPLRYIDPSGKWLESAWDIFNISLGAKSLSDNISQGKYGEAAIDALGMAGDMIALAFPAVPGGFGTGIKASRVGENVIDTGIKTVKANKSNYRKALQQATGKEGNGFEAHHTLPQKHRPDFEKLGINIDEPGHVVWREAKNHRQNSWKFTKEWDKFFDTNKSYTKEDIINFRNEKEKEIFGNYTGDTPEN